LDEFSGLMTWKEVQQSQLEFQAKEFACLLPQDLFELVGQPYWLLSYKDKRKNDLDPFRLELF